MGAMENSSPHSPLLFFDGVCGLCNRSVDFLIERDKARVFRFAPLQGELAKRLLEEKDTKEIVPKAMVLWEDGKIYRGSTAVLRALTHLPGWRLPSRLALLIPCFLRDAVYAFIARNRYRWFGKSETCRLPSAEERTLFYD